MMMANLATWGICGLATAGILLRPLKLPEAVWAVFGALALLCLGLLPMSAAAAGVKKGVDVYLFLAGMMLLAELARQEGLFDWLAARAAIMARGSATRLFGLVYAVGIVVTVFLSNDATAVVLTPAVAAVARTSKVEHPVPYLLICAFIANAASFVLPISNPANLVIYGERMPPLLEWLPMFALPSLLSIGVTYAILRWTQRKALAQTVSRDVTVPKISSTGQFHTVNLPSNVSSAILIGVDLGPNLSVTGSLSTILWLTSLRRDGIEMKPWDFLKLGALIMPPALVLSLGGLLLRR